MPEGFDQSVYHPMPLERDIPVSFIGGAYGFRPSLVQFLKARGIPLSVFGAGWPTNTVSRGEQVSIINRSRINFGHGGIGYSEDLTNMKGRDFEIPGTGGGLYVTTFNPDLARHFVIGAEISRDPSALADALLIDRRRCCDRVGIRRIAAADRLRT